jgi:hypothetical protein
VPRQREPTSLKKWPRADKDRRTQRAEDDAAFAKAAARHAQIAAVLLKDPATREALGVSAEGEAPE